MKKFLAVVAVVLCLAAASATTWAQDKVQDKAQDKATSSSGISGKWRFMLDTPGGDRDVDAEFTVDADGKVSGTWGKTTVAGTFKDGSLNLDFSYTSDEAGTTDQMKIVGKLDDVPSISGTWQFSSYDGTFKALRPKD